MTSVIFPSLSDPANAGRGAPIQIRLVNAQGRPLCCWRISDPKSIIRPIDITLGSAAVTLDMVPQADIASTGAVPTWYEITARAGRGLDQPRFQVPETGGPYQVSELIGAAAIPPGDVLAGRLVPDLTGVPDGWLLTALAEQPVWASADVIGGSTIQLVANGAIGGHRLVIADAAGLAIYADQADPTHYGRVLGLTRGAAASGGTLDIALAGDVTEPSWTWNPGPLWAGSNGLLTQLPSTTGWLQQVATALTATRIVLDLKQPILLL